MAAQKKEEKDVVITINSHKKMNINTDEIRNVGYGILKELYKQLELDRFWNWKTKNLSIEFNVDQIFRLLVFSRILNPASKKGTFDHRDFFFENFDGFSLDDIYHALNIICDNKNALQKWIYDHSVKICARDLSVSYFDCTNYYFDIGRSDMDTLDDAGNPVDNEGKPVSAKYRKRGPEKNHRPDPIVEMGLLMDRNGLPLAFDLFPGNESEKVHMRPITSTILTAAIKVITTHAMDMSMVSQYEGQHLNLRTGYYRKDIIQIRFLTMMEVRSCSNTNPESTQKNCM